MLGPSERCASSCHKLIDGAAAAGSLAEDIVPAEEGVKADHPRVDSWVMAGAAQRDAVAARGEVAIVWSDLTRGGWQVWRTHGAGCSRLS